MDDRPNPAYTLGGFGRDSRGLLIAHGVVLLGSALILYYSNIIYLVRWWAAATHWRFVVVPVLLYMVVQKRHELKTIAIAPNYRIGVPVLLFGGLLAVAAKVAVIDFLAELSLGLVLLGGCVLLFGIRLFAAVLAPFTYLFLATSISEKLIGALQIHLQSASAVVSASLLNTLGWHVVREGLLLRLPATVLEIAPLCSGANQLIALMTFAVPIAYLRHTKLRQKAVVLLAAMVAALAANSIRIVLIAVWNYSTARADVHGPHDVLRMPVIYPLAMLSIWIVSSLSRRFEERSGRATNSSVPIPERVRYSMMRACRLGSAVLVLASLGALAYRPRPVKLTKPLSSIPRSIGQWHVVEESSEADLFSVGEPDEQITRRYSAPNGDTVTATVSYFASQTEHKRLLDHSQPWLYTRSGLTDLSVDSSTVHRVSVYRHREKPDAKLSFYSYFIDGAYEPDRSCVKHALTRNSLLRRRSNAAFVVVTAHTDGGPSSAAELSQRWFAAAFLHHAQQALRSAGGSPKPLASPVEESAAQARAAHGEPRTTEGARTNCRPTVSPPEPKAGGDSKA